MDRRATLHKHLPDLIKYAKDKNIKETSFLTNGYKLKMKYFKTCRSGIDLITVSIDSMGENYNKIRYPLKFGETLQKLKDIQNIKKENNLEKPPIRSKVFGQQLENILRILQYIFTCH